LRVLVVSQTYKPAANGQAVFTTTLAEGLASAGHNVLAVVPSDRVKAYREDRNGVRIEYLTAVPVDKRVPVAYYAVLPAARLAALMDAFQPDVVHIQDHYPLCRTAHRLARRRQLAVVGTNHFMPANVIRFVTPFQTGRKSLTRFLWWTMLSLYRQLDAVTAPSRTAVRLLEQQKLAVPMFPISCGVDRARFANRPDLDRLAVRRSYGISPTAKVFIFVGRLDEEKHIEVAIQALAQTGSDAQLVIVGQGHFEGRLRTLVAALGLDGQVIFTGHVPNEALPGLLQAADVFVMPSEAELLSIATLEAMAAGRPILAAAAGALPELVEPGANGFLFQAGHPEQAAERMRALMQMSDRWAEMGQVSLAKVAPHQVEATIERYVRVYRRVLGAHRSLSEPASLAPAD
jgi:1,2-diacylglycerol 3-alpha-glucosyltransferase